MWLEEIPRVNNSLSASLLFCFRVFLRAINKFAETMNQKFLENMNFEVQVSIFWLFSQVKGAYADHPGLSEPFVVPIFDVI